MRNLRTALAMGVIMAILAGCSTTSAGTFVRAAATAMPEIVAAADALDSALATPVAGAVAPSLGLNFDETGGDALSLGQSQIAAAYLRIDAPISQGALEAAAASIQREAAAAGVPQFSSATLVLDQNVAWLVYCQNATVVDPPADVSLVHEVSLLAPGTTARFWIQVPFAEGVPLRSDDTWVGCDTNFLAVSVY